MFIGGSPGSIAGGIKTTTFTIVLIYAIRGNTERMGLNISGRNLDTAVIEKSFSIVAKSIMILLISIALLLVTERALLVSGSCTVFDLIFEDISAFGTVGLSLGVTSSLTVAGKVVIIATMFIGRTGIFAMALGFAHSEKERFFEYPSAHVLVG
jgi:trk system potassium uptake protein TrkH